MKKKRTPTRAVQAGKAAGVGRSTAALMTVLAAKHGAIAQPISAPRGSERFWIAVDLDADLPVKEIKSLVSHSYELVCEGLTRKQKAVLEGVAK